MAKAAIVLSLLLSSATSHAEEANITAQLIPAEVTIDIKNGEKAKEFLEENSWLKELRGNALYEGLTLRISPFLNQLGNEKSEGWSGKLINFLYDKVLEDRPIRIQYFHRHGMAGPSAITLSDLSGGEQKALRTIMELGNRHKGGPQTVELKGSKTQSIAITPVMIKYQRFAIRFHDDCFTISRDPVAAAMASLQCPKDEPSQDVVVRTNLKSAFPSLFGFAKQLLGLGEWVETRWRWEGKRLVPEKGEMNLSASSAMGNGGGFEPLMQAIPASSWFAITANLSDPTELNVDSIRAYLNETADKRAKRNKVPVALVHLGAKAMERDVLMARERNPYRSEEEGEPVNGNRDLMKVKRPVFVPLTALLLPSKRDGEPLLLDLNKLFSEKSLYEPRFRKVCNGYVAISNEEEAILRIQEACSKKIASLKDLPSSTAGAIKRSDSLSVLLQPSNWLSAALRQGRERFRGAGSNKDLQSAESILLKLPSIHFSGKVDGSKISLEGTL